MPNYAFHARNLIPPPPLAVGANLANVMIIHNQEECQNQNDLNATGLNCDVPDPVPPPAPPAYPGIHRQTGTDGMATISFVSANDSHYFIAQYPGRADQVVNNFSRSMGGRDYNTEFYI